MKAWITKYALSAGIEEVEGDVIDDYPGMFRSALYNYVYGEGKDWHRTKESAVARAEEMRVKKIASLAKQLAALHRMTFSVDDIKEAT